MFPHGNRPTLEDFVGHAWFTQATWKRKLQKKTIKFALQISIEEHTDSRSRRRSQANDGVPDLLVEHSVVCGRLLSL